VLKLAPDELVKLAPRLKSYLRTPDPAWPDVVDAAAFLRSDLGVSKSLWGEACLAMGRERAAIAIAIVSIKDPAHFRTSAGGYFHGMVTKAKAGHLNLDRTLWGMRKANEPRPPGKAGGARSRGGEGRSVTGPRHWRPTG
jgi:replication initiation protein RepC